MGTRDTAPHLRRARAFDEGDRRLLLVAQLTTGWGTRHSASGKTIWCAQNLAQVCPRPQNQISRRAGKA